MKTSFTIFLFSFLLVFNIVAFSQTYNYTSPKDNSILVSLNTNIILRANNDIDPASLSSDQFLIVGSISGQHQGIVKLSDDNKTVLFLPATPFSPNENVSVTVNPGIKSVNGTEFSKVEFQFKTTPLSQRINLNPLSRISEIASPNTIKLMHISPSKSVSTNTLPSDFPTISVDTSNNPANGKIFLDNDNAFFAQSDSIGNFIMILNNDGSLVKYKRTDWPALDFKVEPNGQLSYADIITLATGYFAVRWIVMDTTLTTIDSVQCGNGYIADTHDFLILPNGHYLLFASDPEPVDMSQYGGNPNAIVIGAVIQELDASKNVVFQWRSWDYLPDTASYMSLTSKTVDLIHGNAFDVDDNGNILFSSRHLSSIIKIDRQTGNIDWILGGKLNQFAFYNEHPSNAPTYFSFQHDIRVMPDGDITLFDNGNQHLPTPYSRAVEYKLDELNKTATLVWEYRHTPDIFNAAMGNVQRLSNGNTLIGWGAAGANGSPVVTEVHSDNSIALEISLPAGQTSYRVYKFPWASGLSSASVSQEVIQFNTYPFNSLNDTTGITITFNQLNSSLYANVTVTKYDYSPVNPLFKTTAPVMLSNYFNISNLGVTSYTGDVEVNINNYPAITNPKATIVYARSNIDSSFVPVASSYDSTNHKLTFTTSIFGDFAFGIPQIVDSAYAPVQISPGNGQFVNGEAPVKLVWGTKGIVSSYRLQVAMDSLFTNIITDNSNLTSTSFTINSLSNNATYFWRVNNTNSAGVSNWSGIEKFSASSPFIKIISPAGGDQLYLDSTYVIRWESNVSDTVDIQLLLGNSVASVIGDSVVSGTQAVLWKVPSGLQIDSSYKIKVFSISNNSLSGTSDTTFKISNGVTGISSTNNIISTYKLSQNYPNPFNPSTVIKYSLPNVSMVKIEVFNIIGQKVSTLVNSVQQKGDYAVTWNAANYSSGIYFYSINATNSSGKQFFDVKKMVLLK
jgi:Arylsulfotransferase (ASST)/Bacterial Ig-like domain/Secretion system C-terminal sorting domain